MVNRLSYIVIALMFSAVLTAQDKEFKKLKSYFDKQEYEKCIESAQKSIKKSPKEILPPMYVSLSYFELFKIADDKTKAKNLRNSLKYAAKAKRLDKKRQIVPRYDNFYDELKKSSTAFGNDIFYGENKDKSKFIYDYIAKIYQDTTIQYREFHPESKKELNQTIGLSTRTQKINQTDANGLKQGFWTKKYKNGVTAYELTFKNDKPVGNYKRCHENGKLNAFLVYDDEGKWANAKMYDEDGILIAEGKYNGKLKEGQWIYSDKGKKVAEETYKNGKKTGVSKTFFENGNISEEKTWENDVEDGAWRQYYLNSKKRLETRIDKGVRNSVYYLYYPNGMLEIRGQYKNDRMDGEWIYYDKKGKVKKKIKYIKGIAENQDELDEEEQKIFKQFEKNKKRLMDPKDYINNPYEYMKANGLK